MLFERGTAGRLSGAWERGVQRHVCSASVGAPKRPCRQSGKPFVRGAAVSVCEMRAGTPAGGPLDSPRTPSFPSRSRRCEHATVVKAPTYCIVLVASGGGDATGIAPCKLPVRNKMGAHRIEVFRARLWGGTLPTDSVYFVGLAPSGPGDRPRTRQVRRPVRTRVVPHAQIVAQCRGL